MLTVLDEEPLTLTSGFVVFEAVRVLPCFPPQEKLLAGMWVTAVQHDGEEGFLPLHLSSGKLATEDLVLVGPSSAEAHKHVSKPGGKETLSLSKRIKCQVKAGSLRSLVMWKKIRQWKAVKLVVLNGLV